MSKLKIIQVGLGPIGLEITRILQSRENADIVGAIDIDPEKQGIKLGKLAGVDCDVEVSNTIDDVPDADVAVVATTSSIEAIAPQLAELNQRGLPVVSTCEEMSYPWEDHSKSAEMIDACAKENKVAVLGTGVNPGFLMDFLPIVSSGLSEQVDSILVERIQDASIRRLPFQEKIGAGLTRDAYQAKLETGSLRHVGLTESVYLIVKKIGWEIDRVNETIEPVVAANDDRVMGTRQVATAIQGDNTLVRLVFQAALHEPEPVDRIVVTGKPGFTLAFDQSVNGDTATAAIIVNAIPTVLALAPGLKTMADVSLLSYWH